jgi:hypothetical protein
MIEKTAACFRRWAGSGYVGTLFPLLRTEGHDGTIEICGSGGAPELSGEHPVQMSNASAGDSYCYMPRAQSMENPINRALLAMAERAAVVAVFADPLNFHLDLLEGQSGGVGEDDGSQDKVPGDAIFWDATTLVSNQVGR